MKIEPFNAFLTTCQIWKACATKSDRVSLEYVFFKNGRAYASDSHILACIPMIYITNLDEEQQELLDGCAIYGPLMKRLTEHWPLRVEKQDGKTYIFANYDQHELRVDLLDESSSLIVRPNFDEILSVSGEKTPISKVGLNNHLLSRLTAALGSSEIKLGFFEESKKIIVEPILDLLYGVRGIIMPMMITGTFEGFE